MNLRPERRDQVDLNITPLIDVVFLLLIFFMVSTTFDRKSEISITLPSASQEQVEEKDDSVNIAVDRQGRTYINDKPLVNSQMLTIREALRDAVSGINDPVIIIDADAEATHQSVVKILDAARQLSLVKLTFSTLPDEDENIAE